MQGLMQDWPLTVGRILDHAARWHGRRPVVGRSVEGPIQTTDYAGIRDRALRLTQALRRLGVAPGEVVGAMAWNTARHLEVWYGVPGAGAVLHSLNPRLGDEQLAFILGHAGDAWVFVDLDLVPLMARLVPRLPALRGVIVLAARADMPPGEYLCYEDLLAAEDGDADWTAVDETWACGICYTSGTTGRPKGVVYSHRSNVLHAMAMIQPDMLALSSRDVLMPVVPLFHANGWSTGYAGPMAGAAMVLPGRQLDPASLMQMLGQGVTVTAAVPSVWLPLLGFLRDSGRGLPDLDRVVIGGSSCPRAVIEAFQNDYGVRVLHAWGMTETSPLGTFCSFKPEVATLDPAARLDRQETVGHPPFTVDLELAGPEGALPQDGTAQGRLRIRGAAVLRRYLGEDTDAIDPAGWFDTGDAATIDPDGYVRITDRLKDVIKSGGEWISSIALENAALAHPSVAVAAAVGMPHPKWGERPVLVVVPRPGAPRDAAAILDAMAPRFARWQLPDEVLFVEAIPHTATGKISKLHLRAELAESGYQLPDLRPA